MNLATVSASGQPSSRIVLLRNFDKDGFVFFTNFESTKGQELLTNHKAALNFFWPELHKQVRIEGLAEKVSDKDSADYFNSRPRESQLGAWVSEQSKELKSRQELDQKFENLKLLTTPKSDDSLYKHKLHNNIPTNPLAQVSNL